LIPALAPRDPKEAYLFYDCQTDDVRLVLTVLGEAERYGAVCLNGAEVVELLDDSGKATGVVCVDAETGERFEVGAANVVNATGVWADRIRPDEILEQEEVPRIKPSRGTHVTVSLERLPLGSAACIVPAGEGRTIFALPWYGRAPTATTTATSLTFSRPVRTSTTSSTPSTRSLGSSWPTPTSPAPTPACDP
jgi:glycerol-3-phosphate dehydrogenase